MTFGSLSGAVLQAENRIFNERNYLYTEPSFFRVFPSLLIQVQLLPQEMIFIFVARKRSLLELLPIRFKELIMCHLGVLVRH